MYIVHFKHSSSFVLRCGIIWDNFLDNDKADEEQSVDQQTGDKQPIDYHHHHFSSNEELHDEPPNDKSTSFINLLDTTFGSSDVILTHTSTVEDDVTKKFWDRLAGI